MSAYYVEYPLQNGFVHNWLVAGPEAVIVAPFHVVGPPADYRTFRAEVFRRFFMPKAGIGATPVERGPLDAGRFSIGKYEGAWAYVACAEDHAVDHSAYHVACHYLRSWAYVELVSERQQNVTLALTTYGPADVWAGEKPIGRVEDPAGLGATAATKRFPLPLDAGVTPLLVRFENVGMGHITHAMSSRLLGVNGAAVDGVHVRLRTLIEDVARRNAFEQLSAAAFVERDVYAGTTPIVLRWPEGKRARCFAHVRLQTPDGRIFLAGDSLGEGGQTFSMGHAMQLPAGPMQVRLMPDPNEVYLHHVRISRVLPLWSLGRQCYTATPWGDLATRRNEALGVAARMDDSPFAQVARMALGAWANVDSKAILNAIGRVQRREDASNMALLALLGMRYRFGDDPNFPAEVHEPLEACAVSYRYGRGEHDQSAGFDWLRFDGECHALVFHVCELLAGQLYGQRTFADGQTGAWHRARGERLVNQWIVEFGTRGMAAWNAPEAIEQAVAALTHLCDLAEADECFELATVALDKLFFVLAHNTWRGVWGVAGQRVSADVVKSGLLLPVAPLCNLMWGMGIFNRHVAGVVSLACSTNYQMPALFEQIGMQTPTVVWAREQHAAAEGTPANVVIYQTPDFMLSSVQDYRARARGAEELAWRATLNAEATIFANHPGSSSESPSRKPGFWVGNGRLPRVAQWQDALLAIYHLGNSGDGGDDDGGDLFDFTHAYFPTAILDEHALREGWAFGRVGDGYVALTNSQGLTMSAEGRYALRELRASGSRQCWVVQMGRAALDGDFAAFQTKVLALTLRFANGDGEDGIDGASGEVVFTTLRGDALRFGWSGPLRVNGVVVPLDGFPHYENAYTTTAVGSGTMVVEQGDDGVRLDFGVTS